MAEKVSVKTFTAIFLLSAIVAEICACVIPVDYQAFLNDDGVIGIIDSTNETVKIDKEGSDDGLVGKDRRIEGLSDEKYYMIEKVIDHETNLPMAGYPQYVTDKYPTNPKIPGYWCRDLGLITRIKDKKINALTNFNKYTIRSARPLEPLESQNGKLPYKDGPSSAVKQVDVVDGKITIAHIVGATNKGYLNLSGIITADYEIMAVLPKTEPETSPWGWVSRTTTSSPPISLSSFELQGKDKTIDYIFVNKNASPPDFRFLTVEIGSSIELVDITLRINWEDNGTPKLTSDNGTTFSQSGYYTDSPPSITINIIGLGEYSIVEWGYDGKSITFGNTNSITIDNTGVIDYFAVGKHTITLIIKKGEKNYYSADFTFTVDP